MKYRRVTSLPDSEIKGIINLVFDVNNAEIVRRDKEKDIIICGFEDIWGEDSLIEDTFEISAYGIEDIGNDYPLEPEHKRIIEKFLVAKGCHYLQKNNPF